MQNKIIVICGPTASGKSSLACHIAKQYNGIVINGDAMQVYKGVSILTAQPTLQDQSNIEHRLYSIIDLNQKFSVAIWLELVIEEIYRCKTLNKIPIIVGGSGLYLKSLIYGLATIPLIPDDILQKVQNLSMNMNRLEFYNMLMGIDPELAARLSISDTKRIMRGLSVFMATGIPLSSWQKNTKPIFSRDDFFVRNQVLERNIVYKNCDDRFLEMIANGAIDEVMILKNRYPGFAYPKILGLYELLEHLEWNLTLSEAIQNAQQKTRNYAKRQMTWFKHQMEYDE